MAIERITKDTGIFHEQSLKYSDGDICEGVRRFANQFDRRRELWKTYLDDLEAKFLRIHGLVCETRLQQIAARRESESNRIANKKIAKLAGC